MDKLYVKTEILSAENKYNLMKKWGNIEKAN
jgi:hypothetical protein